MRNKAILPVEFYDRPTLAVTRDLIGKFLVRRFEDGSEVALPIHEAEAYDGFSDKASHAHRGVTPRTAVMYGPPGVFYVYFCYGIHWLLNVVTGPEEYPAAILIRGAGEYSGPARLTKALGVNGSHNRTPATAAEELWLENRGSEPPADAVTRAPRIGVDYAGPVWSAKPYRFVWEERANAAKKLIRRSSPRSNESPVSR